MNDELSPKILEYSKLLTEDLQMNEMNIKERSLMLPAIKSKWLRFYFSEQRQEIKLKKAIEILTEDYIKTHGQAGIKKYQMRGEAEKSNEIQTLEKELESQRELIRFLDSAIRIVNSSSFDVSNSINLIKLENA